MLLKTSSRYRCLLHASCISSRKLLLVPAVNILLHPWWRWWRWCLIVIVCLLLLLPQLLLLVPLLLLLMLLLLLLLLLPEVYLIPWLHLPRRQLSRYQQACIVRSTPDNGFCQDVGCETSI